MYQLIITVTTSEKKSPRYYQSKFYEDFRRAKLDGAEILFTYWKEFIKGKEKDLIWIISLDIKEKDKTLFHYDMGDVVYEDDSCNDILAAITVISDAGYPGTQEATIFMIPLAYINLPLIQEHLYEIQHSTGEKFEYLARIADIEDEEEREQAYEDYYGNCYARVKDIKILVH